MEKFGADHPQTAWSLRSLGRMLRQSGNIKEAREYLSKALAIYCQVKGPDHMESINTRADLAQCTAPRDASAKKRKAIVSGRRPATRSQTALSKHLKLMIE